MTLIANGENVKVVRELMRHANSRCTLDVYCQASVRTKREAQQRTVEMVMPEYGVTEIKLPRRGPDERLSGGDYDRRSDNCLALNGVIWRNRNKQICCKLLKKW